MSIMNRRRFLITGLGTGLVMSAGSVLWYNLLEQKNDLSIIKLINSLQELSGQTLVFTGKWNATQVFNHLAQSIEFSMLGYPQHKSDLFKSVIGKTAFKVFQKQSSMSHNLQEAIPGAPDINIGDQASALTRLLRALQDFNTFDGALQPHFAYGELSHRDYADAHAMHVLNHFEELQLS
jgi:hypothetical protein